MSKALILLALVASAAATDSTTEATPDPGATTAAGGAPAPSTAAPATTAAAGATTAAAGATTAAPGASTPPAAGACADKVNAKTGVSDCPANANLCNTASYFDFMTVQCPKTCNRCGYVATTPSTCFDAVDPKTGVSNCQKQAAYCTNPAYVTLMTQQCPATCGKCGTKPLGPASPQMAPAPPVAPAPTAGCVDGINSNTGTSDCARLAYLCNNAAYYTLMTQQCPKTCGRCSTGK